MTVPLPTLSTELAPIAQALDALTHEQRVNWVRGLPKREFKAVFGLAKGSALDLDHFCQRDSGVVIHEGQNSLLAFSTFQKRFVRRGSSFVESGSIR